MKYIDDVKDLGTEELGYEDEIIEIENEEGMAIQFYLVGSMDFDGKTYAFFQPAEEVEGVAPEEIIVFEVDEENEDLIEIADKELEKKILQDFSNDYIGEYITEEDYLS